MKENVKALKGLIVSSIEKAVTTYITEWNDWLHGFPYK